MNVNHLPIVPLGQENRRVMHLMNKTLLILAMVALASPSPALEAAEVPDPALVLRQVRASTAQNDELTLQGRLRVLGGKKHGFRMTIRRQQVAFLFENEPQHSIALDLLGENFRLRERHGDGQWADVAPAKMGQNLRGTAVNYLDISLGYLYWPNPEFLQEDVVAERITWKIRVTNPDKEGPYSRLDLWIDRDTRGLMRMQAYNNQGRLVKRMEVKDVQKVKNGDKRVWTLERMAVTAFNPKSGRASSRTYLEL